jgi:restriction system protein
MTQRSVATAMRMAAREAAYHRRVREQVHARHQADERQALRESQRRLAADAEQATQAYVAAQVEEADFLTREIHKREQAIDGLLSGGLARTPSIDLTATLTAFVAHTFNEQRWAVSKPELASFLPEAPGFFARLVPGYDKRHERKVRDAHQQHAAAYQAFVSRRAGRDEAYKEFEQREQRRRSNHELENRKVLDFQASLKAASHEAVTRYFKMVIDKSLAGEPDALSAELGYSTDSKHLVVDLELPEFSIIPEEAGFKYDKAADRIDPIPRALAKRKTLYTHLISQIALKCIDTVFRGDTVDAVQCLTLNGMLDTIDPSTGQQARVCLLSVRLDVDNFRSLNLHQVQPEDCLRSLKASVSRAPTELVPVKPIVELDVVDPRFVETLDQRPNLMALTPIEFEGLLTNLFTTLGLDTTQTRQSRDGGLDCVAFDPRPVLGGKVILHAKRYKDPVGVSAVRDLFGTVQNEGASKGILITTSGYEKAAVEFARGKPLELLDGANLLHLLAEHAKVGARIVIPDGWIDQPIPYDQVGWGAS